MQILKLYVIEHNTPSQKFLPELEFALPETITEEDAHRLLKSILKTHREVRGKTFILFNGNQVIHLNRIGKEYKVVIL